jgi:hypothetical protein
VARLIQNRDALFAAIDADVAKGIKKFANLVDMTTNAVHYSLMEKTPVFTGETVRNYIWTEGTPFGGLAKAIGNQPPGPTNSQPLGTETRRPANEVAATITLENLSFVNPFKKYFVTNNSPSVGGLELGKLPGNGKRSRSPNGMFLITEQVVNSKIKSGIIK